MKHILLLLLLPLVLPAWAMENLTQEDYLGEWKTREDATKEEGLIVTFSQSSGFVLKRTFPTGAWQECEAGADGVEYHDGVMLAHCNIKDKLGFKLVVAGHRTSETKIVFGSLYLYQDGVLYKGVPVTLMQDTRKDNKALNTDASDAGAG